MAEDKSRSVVTMVYLGYRVGLGSDNKTLYQGLREIDPEENDGRALATDNHRERWYEAKRNKGVLPYGQPGSVWEVEAERDPEKSGKLTVFTNTFRVVGQWANPAEVAEWQTASRAIRQAWEARQEGKKKSEERLDLACLDPIRSAYAAATPAQRTFILANAVSYITRGVNTRGE